MIKLISIISSILLVVTMLIFSVMNYFDYSENNMLDSWAVNSIYIDGIDSTNYFKNLYFIPTRRHNEQIMILPRRKDSISGERRNGTWRYKRIGLFQSEIIVVDRSDKTFTGSYKFEVTKNGILKNCTFSSEKIKILCTELSFRGRNSIPVKFD